MIHLIWNPNTIPWIIITALTSSTAGSIWIQENKKKESLPAVLLMLSISLWGLAYIFRVSSPLLSAQLFWLKWQLTGIIVTLPSYLVYITQYTHQNKPFLLLRKATTIKIAPAIMVGLIFTNDIHQLIWKNPQSGEALQVSYKNYAPIFWLYVLYSVVLIILSIIELNKNTESFYISNSWQNTLLSLSVIIVCIITIADIDISQLFVGIVGFFITRRRSSILLRKCLIPISHKYIIKKISEGIIVLDKNDLIRYINPAAQKLFRCSTTEYLDKHIQDFWEDWEQEASIKTTSLICGKKHNVQITPILDWRNRTTGKVLSFCNVSTHKELSDALQDKTFELQYNYDLQSILTKIITEIGYSTSPQQVLEAMSIQLHKLGLEFLLGIVNDNQEKICVEFVSIDKGFLQKAERFTNTPVIGYKLPTSVWPFTDIFQNKKIVFGDNTFDLVDRLLPEIPTPILKKAFAIARIPINEPVMYIPLFTKEKAIGAIAIWGNRLRNANQDILQLFANQIAVTFDNARRYEAKKQTNEELLRSKTFLTALNTVAATLSKTMDFNLFVNSLNKAFENLYSGTFVFLLDKDEQTAIIQYGAKHQPLIDAINKTTNINLKGHQIDILNWKTTERAKDLFSGKTLYIDNAFEWISSLTSKLSFKRFKKTLLSVNQNPDETIIILPLMTPTKAFGALGIWGKDIREEDIPTLKIFASQVSSTLQNAHLYQLEQERSQELARAKAFTTALSAIAASISQTRDLDLIIEILGAELNKLGLTNLLARLSTDEQNATVKYVSISTDVLETIKKITGVNLQEYVITKKYWKKITKEYFYQGKALFVAEPFNFTTPIIPKLSSKVLLKAVKINKGHTKYKAVYLPLLEKQQVYGILGIWGIDLREEDIPTLMIFASQVASTLENARLHIIEQHRSQELATSLEEKSVLLKEVHHGEKNNLQVISSLLNLQAAKISDTEILNMFSESRNRIQSMVLVHEKLYQSSNFTQINFGKYLRGLSEQLMQSYSSQSRAIRMKVDIENINLSIEQAVPCGLIVNEIITNSIKHAFPKDQEGSITIKLHKIANQQVKLIIEDNGIGIPNFVSIENPSTLGMQIINLLSDQINGEINIFHRHGTGFEITF